MKPFVCLLTACGLLAVIPIAAAQRGGDDPGPPAKTQSKKAKSSSADSLLTRMMQFDENKDGKLTKAEVTDERLQRLFARADADHDGVVTRQELTALAAGSRLAAVAASAAPVVRAAASAALVARAASAAPAVRAASAVVRLDPARSCRVCSAIAWNSPPSSRSRLTPSRRMLTPASRRSSTRTSGPSSRR